MGTQLAERNESTSRKEVYMAVRNLVLLGSQYSDDEKLIKAIDTVRTLLWHQQRCIENLEGAKTA